MAEEKITINLTESNILNFGVNVKGIETNNIMARFVIESENVSFSFSSLVKNGEAEFDLPILSKHLKPDTYKARLEVIIENERLFTPVEIDVDAIQPIAVNASVESKGKNITEQSRQKNNETAREPIVTVSSYSKKSHKSKEELIEENFDSLVSAKNINQLLYIYSQKVLLRESYIPISAADVLPELNKFCLNKYNKTFKQYITDKQ